MDSLFRTVWSSNIYVEGVIGARTSAQLQKLLEAAFPDVPRQSQWLEVDFSYYPSYNGEGPGTATLNARTGPPFNLSALQFMSFTRPVNGSILTFSEDPGCRRRVDGTFEQLIMQSMKVSLSAAAGPSTDFSILREGSNPIISHLKSIGHGTMLSVTVVLSDGTDDKPDPSEELLADVARISVFKTVDEGKRYRVLFRNVIDAWQSIMKLHGNTERPHKTIQFCNRNWEAWPELEVKGTGLGKDGEMIVRLGDFYQLLEFRQDMFDITQILDIGPMNCCFCRHNFALYGIHGNLRVVGAVCECKIAPSEVEDIVSCLARVPNHNEFYLAYEPVACFYTSRRVFEVEVSELLDLEMAQSLIDFVPYEITGYIFNATPNRVAIRVHISQLLDQFHPQFAQNFSTTWSVKLGGLDREDLELVYLTIFGTGERYFMTSGKTSEAEANRLCLTDEQKGVVFDPIQFLTMVFQVPDQFSTVEFVNRKCKLISKQTSEYFDKLKELVTRVSHYSDEVYPNFTALIMGETSRRLLARIRIPDPNIKLEAVMRLGRYARQVVSGLGSEQKRTLYAALQSQIYLMEEEYGVDGTLFTAIMALLWAVGYDDKVLIVCANEDIMDRMLELFLKFYEGSFESNVAKYAPNDNPYLHSWIRNFNNDLDEFDYVKRVADLYNQRGRRQQHLESFLDLLERFPKTSNPINLDKPKKLSLLSSKYKNTASRYLMKNCKIMLTTPMGLFDIVRSHEKEFLHGINVIAHDITRIAMPFSLSLFLGKPNRLCMVGSHWRQRHHVYEYGANKAGLGKSLYDLLNIRGYPYGRGSIQKFGGFLGN